MAMEEVEPSLWPSQIESETRDEGRTCEAELGAIQEREQLGLGSHGDPAQRPKIGRLGVAQIGPEPDPEISDRHAAASAREMVDDNGSAPGELGEPGQQPRRCVHRGRRWGRDPCGPVGRAHRADRKPGDASSASAGGKTPGSGGRPLSGARAALTASNRAS